MQQMIGRQCVGALVFASAGLFAPLSSVGCQKEKHKGNVPDSTFARGIPARPGGTLVVNLGTGGSLVLRGWDRDYVNVRAHLSGPDWHDTKLHLDRVPSGVRLRTNLGDSALGKSTSHEFEVWVPRTYSLELQSAGGGLDIQNLNGNFRGQIAGGSIELANVHGVANLSTRDGNIVISDSHLDGVVITRGGAVKLTRVTGGVRAAVERESSSNLSVETIVASFNKNKHEVKQKQGVRNETYLDVRNVPVIKPDYANGLSEPFEAVFMNRTTIRSPLDKGVTAFGLGVIGRRFRVDTLNVNRVFYRLKR